MGRPSVPLNHANEVEHRRLIAGRANAAVTDNHFTVHIDSPSASEDVTIGFVDRGVIATKVVCVVVGTTPSVTWSARHDADRSAAGTQIAGQTTTSTTTGDVVVVGESIDPDSHLWVETSATSGTVNSMHITIFYSEAT